MTLEEYANTGTNSQAIGGAQGFAWGGDPNQQTTLQHVCPACGPCPCCGRRNPYYPYPTYPVWPAYPMTPWDIPQPWTITYCLN